MNIKNLEKEMRNVKHVYRFRDKEGHPAKVAVEELPRSTYDPDNNMWYAEYAYYSMKLRATALYMVKAHSRGRIHAKNLKKAGGALDLPWNSKIELGCITLRAQQKIIDHLLNKKNLFTESETSEITAFLREAEEYRKMMKHLQTLPIEKYKQVQHLRKKYPDLKVEHGRWRSTYISSLLKEEDLSIETSHSCGCCPDAGIRARAYLLQGDQKVYHPSSLYVGETYDYTEEVWDDDWKEAAKKAGFSDFLIEKISKERPENEDDEYMVS